MGHANLSNVSRRFLKMLHEHRTVTIRQVVDALEADDEGVHASEGLLTDTDMLAYGVEMVVGFLMQHHGHSDRTPERRKTPVIEPVEPLTDIQEIALQEWIDGENDHWDCGDDGDGGDYGVLDSIPWRFTEGWERSYPRIPILAYHEN